MTDAPGGERPSLPSRKERQAFRRLLKGSPAQSSAPASADAEADPDGPTSRRAAAGQVLLQSLGVGGAAEATSRYGSGIMLMPRPGAARVTIVFSGNTRIFALPRPLLAREDTHTILIRDPTRCFGLLGVPGLGDDYPSCLANLRKIMDALMVTDSFCMGISAGGSAALRFGCDLGVSGVLGFSVPTTLNLDDDPGAELKNYPQLTLLYRRARHLGIDLAAYYMSCAPRPRAILVYSRAHPRDAWLAERMRGMVGVELLDTPDFQGHTTYQFMTDNGRMEGLVKRLFGLRPTSAMIRRKQPVSIPDQRVRAMGGDPDDED